MGTMRPRRRPRKPRKTRAERRALSCRSLALELGTAGVAGVADGEPPPSGCAAVAATCGPLPAQGLPGRGRKSLAARSTNCGSPETLSRSTYECCPSQVWKAKFPAGAPETQFPVTSLPGVGATPHQAEVTLCSTGLEKMLLRTFVPSVVPVG